MLAASKPDRDIVIHYSRSKPWLSVISMRSLHNELLVRSAIAVGAWLLIFATLIAERREKAGIVGTIRQRLLIDRGRRGPAVAGRADREGPSQR